MPIQAVIFDIGGVLETTPDPGADGSGEPLLRLGRTELCERMRDVWCGGNIGTDCPGIPVRLYLSDGMVVAHSIHARCGQPPSCARLHLLADERRSRRDEAEALSLRK